MKIKIKEVITKEIEKEIKFPKYIGERHDDECVILDCNRKVYADIDCYGMGCATCIFLVKNWKLMQEQE